MSISRTQSHLGSTSLDARLPRTPLLSPAEEMCLRPWPSGRLWQMAGCRVTVGYVATFGLCACGYRIREEGYFEHERAWGRLQAVEGGSREGKEDGWWCRSPD